MNAVSEDGTMSNLKCPTPRSLLNEQCSVREGDRGPNSQGHVLGAGTIAQSDSPKKRTPFVVKLHTILDQGWDHIIAWQPCGSCFAIVDEKAFEGKILPAWYGLPQKYDCFVRKLHFYGFRRIRFGRWRGSFFHEKFHRDNRAGAYTITRKLPSSSSFCDEAVQWNRKRPPSHAGNVDDDLANVIGGNVNTTSVINIGGMPYKLMCLLVNHRPMEERVLAVQNCFAAWKDTQQSWASDAGQIRNYENLLKSSFEWLKRSTTTNTTNAAIVLRLQLGWNELASNSTLPVEAEQADDDNSTTTTAAISEHVPVRIVNVAEERNDDVSVLTEASVVNPLQAIDLRLHAAMIDNAIQVPDLSSFIWNCLQQQQGV